MERSLPAVTVSPTEARRLQAQAALVLAVMAWVVGPLLHVTLAHGHGAASRPRSPFPVLQAPARAPAHAHGPHTHERKNPWVTHGSDRDEAHDHAPDASEHGHDEGPNAPGSHSHGAGNNEHLQTAVLETVVLLAPERVLAELRWTLTARERPAFTQVERGPEMAQGP